jgi:DNA-binding NtrC family response regulator
LETDSLSEALKMIASERLELLIIELDFPRKENCKLIDAFRQHHCEHRDAVVVTTTQRPSGAWRREYKPRATVYKPFDIRHLSKIITSIIEQERRKNAEMSVVDRARP